MVLKFLMGSSVIKLVNFRPVNKQVICWVTIIATIIRYEFMMVFSPCSVINEISFFNAGMQHWVINYGIIIYPILVYEKLIDYSERFVK